MKKVIGLFFCVSYITSQAQTAYPTAPPSAGNITAIEYFLDNNNPAIGSGTALTGFTALPNVSAFAGTATITSVPSGFHRIYFRSQDANGRWSHTSYRVFDNYNVPIYAVAPAAATNIVHVEYFIDNNDLGFGNCTPIAITPNTNIANFNTNINITGLAQGAHFLYIRSKDAAGKWSLTNISYFSNAFSQAYPGAPNAVTNIVQMEYFIDNNDLGFGNCTQIAITPNTNIANFSTNINVASLAQGSHRLFIRSKDATGKWSLTNLSIFDNTTAQAYPTAPASAPAINVLEYFIDTDPGFGLATPLTVPGNTGDVSNYAVSINLSGSLSLGTHYLYIRSKQNPYSLTQVVPFNATSGLPISWQYVKAQLQNNKGIVTWATTQENNSSMFDVEWSTNGAQFAKIGEIAAAGTSSILRNYSFTHNNISTGFNYYRLKQIDLNGDFKYSMIVKILYNENIKEAFIAPNPVVNMLNLVEPKSIFINSIEVYNSKGSLLLSKNINSEVQVYSLPVSKLANGSYVLKVRYKNGVKSIAFVK